MSKKLDALSTESYSVYMKMVNYLSEKHLNSREYERVCDDVYMILFEAQERGDSPENLFPDGLKQFCDEVAENCSKEKWYETVLRLLFWALGVFAAVIFVNTLFTWWWPDDGEWVKGVNLCVSVGEFVGAFIVSVAGASVSFLNHKLSIDKKWPYWVSLAIVLAVLIGAAILVDYLIKDDFITLNWVALGCGTAAGAVILWSAKRFITRICTK